MCVQTINIEPHWEGLRAYVLAMYEDEPEVAREIAEAMGDEAPELPERVPIECDCGQGDPPEHVICSVCGDDWPECECVTARSGAD